MLYTTANKPLVSVNVLLIILVLCIKSSLFHVVEASKSFI